MRPKIRTVLIVLGLVLTCTLVFFAVQGYRFRLVDSSPKNSTFPSSSNEVVLYFNKNLDPDFAKSGGSVEVNQPVETTVFVKGKELHIVFKQNVASNLKLQVNKVTSLQGSVISKINKNYVVEFVPENKLSEYEKKKQLSQSNSFENEYPIIKILPLLNPDYSIDYRFPDSGQGNKLILIIDVLGVSNSPAYVVGQESYLQQVRSQALSELSNKGYKPQDYTIKYAEDVN